MAAAGPRSQAADAVIQLRGIKKAYDEHVVIENLELDIQRGEFLTLLGPSGCGKTTTLKMIAGFESPSAGQILLNGEDVAGVPPYGRSLNTVFQQYALFPHLSVFDNVAFGPRTQKLPQAEVRKRVEAMLDMVDVREHARKKPDQLSGGQQQRVALARALVNYPSALLLDEPLSALDAKLRKSMQQELKRIHDEVKTTFIFVTHDQEEALTMSTRIAVMNQGRIEQLDTPQEIYHHPRTPFVATFIGQTNLLTGQVTSRGEGTCVVDVPGCGPIRAPLAGTLAAGQQATLMLRPEQLALVAPDAGDAGHPARIGGTLHKVEFHGALTHYTVAVGGARELKVVLSQRDAIDCPFQVGDAVTVTWNAAAVWLIPQAQ